MYIHISGAKRGRDVHVQCLPSSFSFSPIISCMHPSRCMPRVRTTTHPFSHIIHPFVHLRPPAVPPPQPQLQKCSIFIFICPHSLVPHMYVYAHAGPAPTPKTLHPKTRTPFVSSTYPKSHKHACICTLPHHRPSFSLTSRAGAHMPGRGVLNQQLGHPCITLNSNGQPRPLLPPPPSTHF